MDTHDRDALLAHLLQQLHPTAIRRESRSRLSRHYYDMAKLVESDEGRRALTQHDLLARVADYKAMFHRQSAARYDLARAGTLRLIPEPATLDLLRRDYAAMREMFFEEPPSFDAITGALHSAEREINSSVSRGGNPRAQHPRARARRLGPRAHWLGQCAGCASR